MAISSLLKNPIKTSPSSIHMVDHHLKEVRRRSVRAAEVEESSNGPQGTPINPPSATAPILSENENVGFDFGAPTRAYSAEFHRAGASLYPDGVFLSPITVSGPTRDDAVAAILNFRLNSDLNSGGRRKFCILGTAEDGDQSYVDPTPTGGVNCLPDLNFSPPDVSAPAKKFVGDIKSQHIFQFIEYVVSYLIKFSSIEAVEEYKKIMSSLTETQIGNLDSIRVWNILTLGAEIEKVLVENGVIETAICLPPPQEQVYAPPQGYKATASHTDYHPNCNPVLYYNFLGLKETESEDDGKKAKRKAVVVDAVDMGGDPCLNDYMQIKKPRHGGAVGIEEEAIAPIDEAEGSASSH